MRRRGVWVPAFAGTTRRRCPTKSHTGEKHVRPPQGKARICDRRRRRHRPRLRHRLCARGRHGVRHRHRRKGPRGADPGRHRRDRRGSTFATPPPSTPSPSASARSTSCSTPPASCITAPSLDCSEEDWDFSFDLNVKSMHRTIRAFLPGCWQAAAAHRQHLVAARRFKAAGQPLCLRRHPRPRSRLLTRAVAVDFITQGIRCNCICPGTIETPSMLDRAAAAGPDGREKFVARQTMGRLGTAEEIAAHGRLSRQRRKRVHHRRRPRRRRRLHALTFT